MYIARDPIGIRGLGQASADQTSNPMIAVPLTAGQLQDLSASNAQYFGQPPAENQMIVGPLTAGQLQQLSASNAAFFGQGTGSSFATWWSQNKGLVAIGEAVVLGLALLSLLGGGRR